ncbi:hypothetical protein SAY87_015371 [Trapa incisa]|uniref:IBB domain-containing protein n=1 Tax=Trapa incisa TaxID=236973 RepID=A0AAN7GZ92_9MYRT|nr:hypothetical protein SAY87_015371 [Trapa incisa]
MRRRKSQDNLVEIRKNERENSLLKKRREGLPRQCRPQFFDGSQNADRLEIITSMVQGLLSNDPSLLLETTIGLRKLLSIDMDAFPTCKMNNEAHQLSKSSRLVSSPGDVLGRLRLHGHVASGTMENTLAVIENGAVPMLVRLLSTASDDNREQVVWALGNVVGDSPTHRDLVLNYGALIRLLSQLNETSKLSMLRNAGGLCPTSAMARHLHHLNMLWLLEYLLYGSLLSYAPISPSLLHPPVSLPRPEHAFILIIPFFQFIIDNWALPCLLSLQPKIPRRELRKKPVGQFQTLQLRIKPKYRFLVDEDFIKPPYDLLICPYPKIGCLSEELQNILKVGEVDKERGLNNGVNIYAVMIDECEGLDKIDHLQFHNNMRRL